MVIELMYNIVFDDVIAAESKEVIELYDLYKYEKEDCIRSPNSIECEHCKHVPGYHSMQYLLNQLFIEIENSISISVQLQHVTTLFVLLKYHPEIVKYNANLRDTLIYKAREFKQSPAADRKTKKLFNDFVIFAKTL